MGKKGEGWVFWPGICLQSSQEAEVCKPVNGKRPVGGSEGGAGVGVGGGD